MNDRNALFELNESPGFLLQELGIGEEVFVYRPCAPEDRSGFVSCETLDEDIANRGRGFLFRKSQNGGLAFIRLWDEFGCPYRLLFLEYDFSCPSGNAFLLCLREEEELQRTFYCSASRLKGLDMQSSPEDEIVPPWKYVAPLR